MNVQISVQNICFTSKVKVGTGEDVGRYSY